jgi:hypothetical protein
MGKSRLGGGGVGFSFSSYYGKWFVSGRGKKGVCGAGVFGFGRALGLFGPAGSGGVEEWAENFGLDGSSGISFFGVCSMGYGAGPV